MRTIRTVASLFVTLALALVAVSVPTSAEAASAKPKRVLSEQAPGEHQVTYNAFKLKGKVEEPQADGSLQPYAKKKVIVQKKACKKCSFKKVKKIKTNNKGKYKTRIYAPRNGRWKWRVKIPSSNGYAVTKGKGWVLLFR